MLRTTLISILSALTLAASLAARRRRRLAPTTMLFRPILLSC